MKNAHCFHISRHLLQNGFQAALPSICQQQFQQNNVGVATASDGTLDVSRTRLSTSMCSFLPEVRLMTSSPAGWHE